MVIRAMSMEMAEKGLKLSVTERERGRKEQSHCVLQLFGRGVSTMWQKRSSIHCGNIRFGIEDERISWEQKRRREEDCAT